ncbi:hypothetical protein Tsubulata_027873 [Turnera subulata]|uniref:NAD-dependent epimerase/dehydratase domain-containing protein n=1 Tax=Turnera subulata TaxID=218843 RepID=A0A9Q0FX94_9ROSI|nr:hypothetical protein Tsubulata_027873 [Turnera subulata]
MEKKTGATVCVTGGSGYIGSSLVKKLLERGYTVHATLRNLEDKSKVGLLKSLPNAATKLFLFQADITNPNDFDAVIKGCDYVLHVAHPMPSDPKITELKDFVEATVAGLRNIADSCLRSQTVKRLIYTASVTASSALMEDGSGYKSCIDESCWTPLDLSLKYGNQLTVEYTKAKTLVEKEALRYNENGDNKLEVVSLVTGLVGGETILSYLPQCMATMLSPATGNLQSFYGGLGLLEELLASVPVVHIEDVCEAHLFCMEKPSIKGRFICVAANPTIRELVTHLKENHPELKIDESCAGEAKEGIACDSSKLTKIGFEYKFGLKNILDDSLQCAKRLGVLKTKSLESSIDVA